MRCALTALAFSLILVLASAGPGDAAKRLPVTIDFRIEPSVVQDQYWFPSDITAVETTLRRFVLTQLGDLFEYWSFRGPGQPRRHRLEFWIRPWQGDSAMMLLVPVINGRAEYPVARYLWQAPGELTSTGLSGPMVEAEKLKVFVQNVFLMEDNNTAKIEQWLRNNVPIGPESAWMEPGRPDSLMIALPLSIEEFGALQKSIFKISGRTPSGQTEELEAVGVELRAPYPPLSPTPDLIGLAVLAQYHIVGTVRNPIQPPLVARVRQIRLGPVYLMDERPPTPYISDDSEDWVEE